MEWTKKYKKAVTFSYDDGNVQDKKLIGLFEQYNVKGTFNLNSGMDYNTGTWECEGLSIHHLDPACWKKVYRDQEAAVHTVHHPNLFEMKDEDAIRREIRDDRDRISSVTGQTVRGMAYPFGGHTEQVRRIAAEEGMLYGRTTKSSYSFHIDGSLLELCPTCHHDDGALFELAEEFLKKEDPLPCIFYIWGHSYEFDVHNNWERMERFLKLISGKPDIFYGTNSQVLLREP